MYKVVRKVYQKAVSFYEHVEKVLTSLSNSNENIRVQSTIINYEFFIFTSDSFTMAVVKVTTNIFLYG